MLIIIFLMDFQFKLHNLSMVSFWKLTMKILKDSCSCVFSRDSIQLFNSYSSGTLIHNLYVSKLVLLLFIWQKLWWMIKMICLLSNSHSVMFFEWNWLKLSWAWVKFCKNKLIKIFLEHLVQVGVCCVDHG